MKITLYQIDSFTDKIFGGNPAGVIITDEWLKDELMQNIAYENNLSETSFIVKTGSSYTIRWFAPLSEIDLCGHATLASAYVLFNTLQVKESVLKFNTLKRGQLSVIKNDNDLLEMNFPADIPSPIPFNDEIIAAIGLKPKQMLKGINDYLLIYDTQQEIESIKPNFHKLSLIDARGIIVSSIGDDVDFVSRFFAPSVGINEDPVTGSAHTTLTPYWSTQLDKTKLIAKQISKREGDLICENLNDRVSISGKAILYMTAEIYV